MSSLSPHKSEWVCDRLTVQGLNVPVLIERRSPIVEQEVDGTEVAVRLVVIRPQGLTARLRFSAASSR